MAVPFIKDDNSSVIGTAMTMLALSWPVATFLQPVEVEEGEHILGNLLASSGESCQKIAGSQTFFQPACLHAQFPLGLNQASFLSSTTFTRCRGLWLYRVFSL